MLAHYRVGSVIGRGGMGEVFQATDTKLGREVALKLLPEEMRPDGQRIGKSDREAKELYEAFYPSLPSHRSRMARFVREARVLASLNHPGIASIYGFEEHEGSRFLVMELVEGPDLSERLKAGPLPIIEALEIGKQIAEALEAAHEKGVIHRDLKPGNIKLTAEGLVMVLDFGLAKAADGAGASDADSQSPPVTSESTQPGMVLGTPAYMSPEQARGQEVNKQTDVWALGCVLYETLTGRRLFKGTTATDAIGAVLHKEPDWTSLPDNTPPTIHLLLRRCLAKDCKRRLHDIADARVELEEALADPSSSFPRLADQGLSANRSRPKNLLIGAAAIALVASAIGWFVKPTAELPTPPLPRAIHTEAVLQGVEQLMTDYGSAFALSPNAQSLVYGLADPDGPLRLRRLGSRGDVELQGTQGARAPFFSPDGKSIGFFNSGQLWRMRVDGEKPIKIADRGLRFPHGASWSERGDIVFALGPESGLIKVSENGVELSDLTTLGDGEFSHRWPQCLPGGRHVLFTVVSKENRYPPSRGGVAVADMETGEHFLLPSPQTEGCTYARYAESGHLLYVSDWILFAVPFDLEEFKVTGERQEVVNGVAYNWRGGAQFDVSSDGTLVYLPGEEIVSVRERTLIWLDSDGTTTPIDVRGEWQGTNYLRDDKRLVLQSTRESAGNEDIWIVELGDQVPIRKRFTFHEGRDFWPKWSPDGEWIFFTSLRNGKSGIWKKKADFSAEQPEPVFEHDGLDVLVCSISHDGKYLFYMIFAQDQSFDIWSYPLQEENPQRTLIIGTPADEMLPMISPDGKLLAYISTESGKHQLYVKPFNAAGSFQQLTWEGAFRPRWSHKGDRLFYTRGTAIWSVSVPVQAGVIVPGKPKQVVNLPSNGCSTGNRRGNRLICLVS